ncbi:hypothetical protein [Effusibacillus lacus]|uniref:Uncharacterized protein n=1 Tax=Effusibacillus lacus TaxID=1348429 RepID=A0A292YKG7_9BACL|nr:hypothetical protein [Effusibacillus lacus]TCS75505.1 hypothetical protein EDD64_10762 [Effusibacillus lacus]GAX88970.1 hypothetical protein EFBL_0584 [Effusibacillus lacus]
MELSLTAEQVLEKIRQMHRSGANMTKRNIKKEDPELLRHASYYYPSWEHACKETGIEI